MLPGSYLEALALQEVQIVILAVIMELQFSRVINVDHASS